MNILVVLIPLSLILGGIGLAAFLWTVQYDQCDESAGNAERIFMDNDDMGLSDAPDDKFGKDNTSGPRPDKDDV
jgi:cbb3-type cytochrome oxidase maturation protein